MSIGVMDGRREGLPFRAKNAPCYITMPCCIDIRCLPQKYRSIVTMVRSPVTRDCGSGGEGKPPPYTL